MRPQQRCLSNTRQVISVINPSSPNLYASSPMSNIRSRHPHPALDHRPSILHLLALLQISRRWNENLQAHMIKRTTPRQPDSISPIKMERSKPPTHPKLRQILHNNENNTQYRWEYKRRHECHDDGSDHEYGSNNSDGFEHGLILFFEAAATVLISHGMR